MLKKLDKTRLFKIVFSAISAILFVLFFSYSTSPIYKEYYGGDSAQFQTVGKIWAEGGEPYKDAFDHKGPIIFLMNKVGYKLTGNKTGVAIVQIICIFVSLLAIFKILELASNKLFYGVIGVIVTLIFLKIFYFEGNITEEYCLPFITIAFYGLVKFFTRCRNNKKEDHPPLWAAIYGLCFGVCLMSQVTNALPIGIGVLIITVYLIKNKNWKNLFRNIGYCLVGVVAIVLPLLVYFAAKGLLGDLLFCSIGYNIDYASGIGTWIKDLRGDVFVLMGTVLFPTYMLLLTSYFAWKRKKYLYSIFLIVCGFVEIIWFCVGEAFPQYEMVTVPQVALLLNEVLLMKKNDENRIMQIIIITLTVIVCFGQTQTILNSLPENYKIYNNQTIDQQDAKELINSIPDTERDSFVAYGGNELKDVYLRNNIKPYYKYFAIQDWHGKFNDKVRNDIHDTFSQGDVKWILADEDKKVIQDVIDSRYEPVQNQGRYTLYRVTEN